METLLLQFENNRMKSRYREFVHFGVCLLFGSFIGLCIGFLIFMIPTFKLTREIKQCPAKAVLKNLDAQIVDSVCTCYHKGLGNYHDAMMENVMNEKHLTEREKIFEKCLNDKI